MTLRRRRAIVKTFIYSVSDYVLYLQPLDDRMMMRTADLELMCLRFIIGVTVKPREMKRAMLLTCILPIRARRRRHFINAVTKFCNSAREEEATLQAQQNWDALSGYNTIDPFVKTSQLPDTTAELPIWREWQTSELLKNTYS